MEVFFNLPKFGPAEFAVGRLLDGDLPDNDEERWSLLSAPQQRIQALLDDHLRAQAALRVCRDSGQPFALFLRTFSAEYSATRGGKEIVKAYRWSSARLQQWIADLLAPKGVPLVKLHGGSDSLSADLSGGGGHALSTNGANWGPVAAELIRAASVIVLLITDATPGVVLELELIRKFGRTHRCLVAIASSQFDPELIKLVSSGAGILAHDAARPENAPADLTGFANVAELHSPSKGEQESYPNALKQGIMRLISGARTQAPLDRAGTVEFSYLEHAFVNSGDFAVVERQLWDQLRVLRVMFDDTYWSALRAHGIEFHCFSYEHLWIEVHRMYGFAIETADFRALAEVLSYLLPFTVYRDADFALLIPVLAGEYEQLGRQLFPAGPPDNESQYATVTDLSKLPAELSVAVSIYQAARTWQNQDMGRALSYYQAALVCALRATDSDSNFRSAIIGDIAQTWARGQEKADLSDWALANFSFALKLFRDLAAADREQYTDGLVVCLNNLGGYHQRRADLQAADACFTEALDICRSLPTGQAGSRKRLTISLMNLGLVRSGLGDHDSARALYQQGLELCRERLRTESEAIIDLTRVQALMSLCLAKIPATRNEAGDYARRAADGLSAVAKISPEAVQALRPIVEEAKQASGISR